MRVLFFTATLVFFSLVPSVIGGTSAFDGALNASPTPTPTQNVKRNERPLSVAEEKREEAPRQNQPRFRYVFSQPNFVYRRMVVEHDSTGKGIFTFEKMNSSETITEEITVSERVLGRIESALTSLDFLNSSENYQHKRDYSHLGDIELTVIQGEQSRSVTFNWTENVHARALMDDYRRITQQSIWIFDMNISRENQPLDSPGLMVTLDSLLKRNEIADPLQILPFLDEISVDERLPLIARNRARSTAQSIRRK
jgi:hypothetical protein